MDRPPITILHFTVTVVRGGVEEHILLLLRELDRRYFRQTLVCPPQLAGQMKADIPADVELIPFEVGRGLIAAASRFARLIRGRQVDILHSHMFQASRFSSPVGRFCGVPVKVETSHARESWRKGWIKGSYLPDRVLGHFVDYYVAVSEANARYLVEEKGLPERKVVTIQNSANVARFNPAHLPPDGMRRDLGLTAEDCVLMVLGRLEPQKGHRFLIEAFVRLNQRFPHLKLVCVGDGCLREELQRRVNELQLANQVRFAGFQTNVEDWLALADVCVLPSLYEGLPLVAIECLAAGRPMVATGVDGTPEVIVNEKTGLIVPPADPIALENAIARMLLNPEFRERVVQAGRRWVLERFTPERQIREMNDFYLRAWQQKRPSEMARAAGTN
jgi:glycosyltransferase involved in cell wall biosynthesis